jgi:lipopolysaccharide export LptBFGC system permease protein LptF
VRILSRRFLASYLGLFTVVLIGSLLLTAIVEMLVHFDEIVDGPPEAGGVIRTLSIRVPSLYLRDLIPLASFCAAFLCISLPARGREITAIQSGGIAPQRIALPVLGAALLLSMAALIIDETYLLAATRELNRLESPGEPISYQQGSFWYHNGNLVYNVQYADRETQTLHGVRLFQLDARGRLLRSIRADEVRISQDGDWHFLRATLRSFDPSAPEAAPEIERFEDTVLDLAGEEDLALLGATTGQLSLLQLREQIEWRAREGRNDLRQRAAFHSRLAMPLTVLLFAWLAIPLGMSVERTRSVAGSGLLAIGVLALFQTTWRANALLADNGFAFAAAGPWAALAAFAALGAWLFSRALR